MGTAQTDLWRIPMVRSRASPGPPGSRSGPGPPACHDRRVMDTPPPAGPALAVGADGYPAPSDVTRRPAGAAESVRANRRWWDAAAPAYLAEHGADLGDVDFLWCPEGLREADAHLLGDVAGRRVLEIGCGSAPCARGLRRAGGGGGALGPPARGLAPARRPHPARGPP